MDAERIPSTEERLVGSFLLEGTTGRDALSKALESGFVADWIADTRLRALAEEIISRHRRNEPHDAFTICAAHDGDGDRRGLAVHCFECAPPSLPHALSLVRMLDERRRKSALLAEIDRIRQGVADNSLSVEYAAGELVTKLPPLARRTNALADAGIMFTDWADLATSTPTAFDWIVQDFIAKGFKGDLNAKSKQWKSFFGQQLAHCVACGLPFLGMAVPSRRRVAYFDLELHERAIWERGRAIDAALGATPERGWLYEIPLRGKAGNLRSHAEAVKRELVDRGIDLIVLDPRYKLLTAAEDENSSQGLRGVLEFRDTLATVAAVLMIGHDPKGDVSGKGMADRGAGSYTAGADYDYSLALSPHEQEGYSVLSASSRYRASPPDLTIKFDAALGIFTACPEIEPRVKKPMAISRPPSAPNVDAGVDVANCARKLIRMNGPLPKTQLIETLPKSPGFPADVGARNLRIIVDRLIDEGILTETRGEGRGGVKLISLSTQDDL